MRAVRAHISHGEMGNLRVLQRRYSEGERRMTRPVIPYECRDCGYLLALYPTANVIAEHGCPGCGVEHQLFKPVPKPKRTPDMPGHPSGLKRHVHEGEQVTLTDA